MKSKKSKPTLLQLHQQVQQHLQSLPLRLRLWRQSQTQLWAKLQIVFAALWGSLLELGQLVNSSAVQSYLDKIDVPKGVIIALATFGLITYLAHGHLDTDNDA